MTDGTTQLVGLIGWPVAHSLSPVMHNAIFDALGLNWRYLALPVPPGQVEAAVRGLGALGFRGANVTVPHKQAVIPTLHSVTTKAQALGAVNTLIIERQDDGEPTLAGYNTDVDGFVSALRQGGYAPERGRSAVVVGAGGGARAAVFGLLGSGTAEITVLNRSLQRARALIADLGQRPENSERLRALPLTPETLIETVRVADLLVNATSVGMWPDTDESIWPGDVPIPGHVNVFDMVYNPLETRLLSQARRSGAQPIDGLGMLVGQGAIAFELWTGKGIVDQVASLMRAACERRLKR